MEECEAMNNDLGVFLILLLFAAAAIGAPDAVIVLLIIALPVCWHCDAMSRIKDPYDDE